MGLPYDPTTQYPSAGGTYAISRWMGEFRVEPIVREIDPWHRPGDLTFEQPGAKLINHTSVPMHRPGVQGWGGKFEFDETTGLYLQCKRAMWQKGTKANLFKISNFDVGAFDKSPSTMAIELGNVAPLAFVAMLNGAFSMSPKDKNGNAIDNGALVICRDQIYGGAMAVLPSGSSGISAWVTSTAYTIGQLVTSNGNVYRAGSTATSGATAPSGTTTSSDGTITWTFVYAATNQAQRLVNPANPDFMSGTTWYNCHQNMAITADNIVNVIINQQTRPAMNGVELGLGDEGIEIWVPFANKERTRQLVEVFRQLPGTGATGVTPTQVPITGGSTSQVIFSVQDNPVFGRAKVRAITGMRSDLWCVVSPRPKPLPQYSLFIHAIGGSVGEYAVQDDPAAMGGDTVPHIAVFQFPAGAQSPMFTGAMPGTVAGDIGIAMILNEGYAFGSGMLIDFCFTGYPS